MPSIRQAQAPPTTRAIISRGPMLDRYTGKMLLHPFTHQPYVHIVNTINEGGTSHVYRGVSVEPESRGTEVAVKIMKPEMNNTENRLRERFQREAAFQLQCDHPNILRLYAILEDSETVYLVLEYLKACISLEQRLNEYHTQGKTLAPLQAAQIAFHVLHALEYVHQKGYAHRDLKPGQILFTDTTPRRLLLTDFGLVKPMDEAAGDALTRFGQRHGTPAYMSPEQVSAGPLDGRTDLYSLGVMLYEMLAGQLPFTSNERDMEKYAIDLMQQHMDAVPVSLRVHSPSVPEPLERLVMRLLDKNPYNRPPSARAVENILVQLHAQGVLK